MFAHAGTFVSRNKSTSHINLGFDFRQRGGGVFSAVAPDRPPSIRSMIAEPSDGAISSTQKCSFGRCRFDHIEQLGYSSENTNSLSR